MGDQREMGGFLGKRADLAMNMQLPAEETLTMEFTPLARQMLNAEKLRKRQCLLVLDGIDVGSLFIIEKNSIVLGRGQECDVVLRDDGISRQHAKISIIGPRRIVVEDLSSTNGTYVGGKRISRATLRIGEKILFGRRTMLRFVLDDALDLLYENEICTSLNRDALTGLYNRRYLTHRLESELSFSKRHRVPISGLFFLIDQLGEFNRIYGYHTGDQMLVSVSQSVGEIIRAEDVFGRYLGHVFMIIAQGIDSRGAGLFAQRIREQVLKERIRALDPSGVELGMSTSIGVVTVSEPTGVDSAKFVDIGQNSLEMATERGGNMVVATEI